MNPADVSLTWGEVFSAMGVVLTIIGLFSGALFKLYGHIRNVQADLDDHKLETAKTYVQSEHLAGMKEDLIRSETRTLSAIQGLTERFDRILTQMRDHPRS